MQLSLFLLAEIIQQSKFYSLGNLRSLNDFCNYAVMNSDSLFSVIQSLRHLFTFDCGFDHRSYMWPDLKFHDNFNSV